MIRKIDKKDANEIKIICNVSLEYKIDVDLVSKQIEKLLEDNKHHWIYVYEDIESKKVIGFIHAEIYESLYSEIGLNILGLAVLPENQGKGIGKKLIDFLENKAKENSIKFIRLNSAENRVEAHKFYENNNYICDKKQKRFIKFLENK